MSSIPIMPFNETTVIIYWIKANRSSNETRMIHRMDRRVTADVNQSESKTIDTSPPSTPAGYLGTSHATMLANINVLAAVVVIPTIAALVLPLLAVILVWAYCTLCMLWKCWIRDTSGCGATIAEAEARGCKYEELEAAWLPDHCRNDELSREFSLLGHKPDGTWDHWNDSKHSQELTVRVVSQHGVSPVYITWE